jgi:S1-C subfamily serine protease
MKQKHILFYATALLVVALVTAGCGASLIQPVSNAAAAPPAATVAAPVPAASGPDVQTEILTSVYQRVNPSVVNISITKNVSQSSAFPFPFGNNNNNNNNNNNSGTRPFVEQGLGSGFVYDMQGHIITNNHVVDGAKTVEVTFADDVTVPATVVGTDPGSDLAVIQVKVDPSELHPVTLGNSDQLQVGQRAIAIGNPFGLEGSLTSGIISGMGRTLPASNSDFVIPNIIQTDAPINPGNSGGPLLNDQGEVIGVNSAIVPSTNSNGQSGFLGIGFAIPVNIVKQEIPTLIAGKQFEHPWLGISGTTLGLDLAKAMNLSVQHGVLVVQVLNNSPASKAGLQGSNQTITFEGQNVPSGGDVITAIDNQTVNKFDDLLTYLTNNTKVGQQVTLKVLRNGQEQSIQLTLAARPNMVNTNNTTTQP